MRTSIATVSISGDLREKIEAIARAGFDAVEIFEPDFIAFDGSPAELRALLADAGLGLAAWQPFRDFEGMPEPERSRNLDRAERKFDLMQAAGAELLLVCSNVSPKALGGIDRAAADLRTLGERAARRGLRIGFEALAWGRHVNDHRDAWEIVRRADHPAVGLILDSFHTLSRGIDPDTIRAVPGDRIFLVQIADAPRLVMDVLHWGRHFRTMPGQGELPVTDFLRAVAATGYRGTLSLEIFNDQFRGASPATVARDGRRSLAFLEDEARRAEPALAADLAALPDKGAPLGFEFVEFASEGAEAARLETLFRSLGFAPALRHIAKDVTVWRQGGINLVLNREREGYARSAFLAHGTSVCDVGIRVADAARTVARAEALAAELFAQRRGPGELPIPAIRGVGGSLLHFIDGKTELGRVWEIEFRPVAAEGPPAPDAGLRRIDHIAQTMRSDELLSWVLFYGAILGCRRTGMVDVVDPGGLVRSLAVENADGSFRITLNGAENHRTLAGHFMAESFGSPVQHLAFETADIFATAARLRALGFEPLPISANYYDDIEARFGLAPELAARLRADNILYDREGGAEFLQLYSPNFGEGFFLEIVERRGGYQGYGAPNAPVRIAAQKRLLRPKGMPRA